MLSYFRVLKWLVDRSVAPAFRMKGLSKGLWDAVLLVTGIRMREVLNETSAADTGAICGRTGR